MKRRIPIQKGEFERKSEPWINYDGKVLIIEPNKTGNKGGYQYDGTMCSQGSITGFVVQSFESKSKYFNHNFWYKKTVWATDSNRLYFDTTNRCDKFVFWEADEKKNDANWKKIQAYADEHARPVDKILKAILREVKNKTGIEYELDFGELAYGTYWHEAHIPVKLKNKKYLLTWMNCD